MEALETALHAALVAACGFVLRALELGVFDIDEAELAPVFGLEQCQPDSSLSRIPRFYLPSTSSTLTWWTVDCDAGGQRTWYTAWH